MRARTFLAGVFIALVTAPSALGTAQPYYVQVPISAAAVAADPSLANYNCWDVRVALSGTPVDHFTVADFESILSSGSFYSPPGGGDIPVSPTPPSLAYDTFVTLPGFAVGMNPQLIYIPGSGDMLQPGSNVAKFPRAGEQQSQFSVVWGTPDHSLQPLNGDYLIAQLTVSKDAAGPVVGYIGASSSSLPQFAPSGFFSNGVIVVPEPATVGAIMIAALFLYRGRL
jgi:hypothetical protein